MQKRNSIPTFEASVVLGLKLGYTDNLLTIDDVKRVIKEISKNSGYVFSGTLTPTNIIALGKNTNYEEPGVLVWSSIYPRYPLEKDKFKEDFTDFVTKLAIELHQERVCVRFSDESFMLEKK